MGCGGSKAEPQLTPSSTTASSSPSKAKRVWAKGVGTSFEYLDDKNEWQLISDKFIINQLGRLCAHNNTTTVTYDGRAMGNGQKYKAVQQADGMIVQSNVATGKQRTIRICPFFFEFQESKGRWYPVVDPEALMSLTAVLASSINKTYKYKSTSTGYEGEAEGVLIGEKGLIEQRNIKTQKKRNIRPTPVGPDGAPHFEFLDNHGWSPVSDVCVKQLAAVAAGRGDAHYKIRLSKSEEYEYHALLGQDGFIVQRNKTTNKERSVRPAPWLGHATGMTQPREQRADPTNGYYRREGRGGGGDGRGGGRVEEAVAPPRQGRRAEEFYEPEEVPLGTAISPLVLSQQPPEIKVTVGYYYQPSVMEPGDPGHVPQSLYPSPSLYPV